MRALVILFCVFVGLASEAYADIFVKEPYAAALQRISSWTMICLAGWAFWFGSRLLRRGRVIVGIACIISFWCCIWVALALLPLS